MDLKLVILGMIFVVVLVMMGDNPFYVPEEYKRDPFRYRIEKKLEEDEKQKGSFEFNATGNNPSAPIFGSNAGGTNAYQPYNYGTQQSNTVLVPGPGGSGYVEQQQPGAFSNWQQFQQAIEKTQAQQKIGAVGKEPTAAPTPTAPGTTPANPATQQPKPDGAPAYFLKDGRRIFFSGYKVFVLLVDGQIQSLPDGTHEMSSGEKIIIRGGKRRAIR